MLLRRTLYASLFAVLSLVLVAHAPAQTTTDNYPVFYPDATVNLNVLHIFDQDNLGPVNYSKGANPVAEVMEGADGNLYGTAYNGGSSGCQTPISLPGCGIVFKMTPAGTFTVLYSFGANGPSSSSAAHPNGGLLQGKDGYFYGTTREGGAFGWGSVFKVNSAGKFAIVHSFCPPGQNCGVMTPDSAYPGATLIQASDGSFYGVTGGVIFKMTTAGKVTILHTFGSITNDGAQPNSLVFGKDGNIYGSTYAGGTTGGGTVFKISKTGSGYTILYSFVPGVNNNYALGANPLARLALAPDGSFYGTTYAGGSAGSGTIFKITTAGVLTKIADLVFTSSPFFQSPRTPVLVGSDGNLYTTTWRGGSFNDGTLLQSTTAGALSLVSELNFVNGVNPDDPIMLASTGLIYGATSGGGGTNGTGLGVIYSPALTLAKPKPSITSLVPANAAIGKPVYLYGDYFVGTTSVKFNGTGAAFTVVSRQWIKATVPAGATTGPVSVVNAGGTATSASNFKVSPGISSFTPTSGTVGTTVTITGTSFTGATKVTFGGLAASSFTVNSATQITAMVPAGAVTGKVAVTTASGTGTSTASFTVN
ncbi:MAG TPA: choice-of-anchor tandem repeat GloVer-containing protein [Terriglobales bacterium]|jgi:uncharacterized repeat protein (TIGR03803 family)|nr:choice-of-anchor tandem repeat GloVer-containing protein [Terriglobales bacterium]